MKDLLLFNKFDYYSTIDFDFFVEEKKGIVYTKEKVLVGKIIEPI